MAKEGNISVTIINRNYLPYKGITGESAEELADFLIQKGVSVKIVHVNAEYNTNGTNGISSKNLAEKIYSINTFYNGKIKFLRFVQSLYEGYRLTTVAKRLKSDYIICMTDPPLLNFWAAKRFKRNNIPWALWSMDLYPEAFFAGKLATTKNIIYRYIDGVICRNYPNYIIALGKLQYKYLTKKFDKDILGCVLPCGIFEDTEQISKPSWATDTTKIYLGYCGNIGEAHSSEFLKAVIDNLDAKKFILVLSLYGSKSKEILKHAADKEGIVIADRVLRSELKFIDIHLVSLSQRWVSISVPSKAVSAICAGSIFLYNGVENSDTWQMLKECGWILSNQDLSKQTSIFLNSINRQQIIIKRDFSAQTIIKLKEMKKEAFQSIYNEIRHATSLG